MGGRGRLGASWGRHGTEAIGRIADELRPNHCFPLASDRPHRQNSRLFFGVPPPVANIKSAEKRARQTVKRRERNVAARSKLRTAIKGVVNAVNAGN
jgi:hypothetical protein